MALPKSSVLSSRGKTYSLLTSVKLLCSPGKLHTKDEFFRTCEGGGIFTKFFRHISLRMPKTMCQRTWWIFPPLTGAEKLIFSVQPCQVNTASFTLVSKEVSFTLGELSTEDFGKAMDKLYGNPLCEFCDKVVLDGHTLIATEVPGSNRNGTLFLVQGSILLIQTLIHWK